MTRQQEGISVSSQGQISMNRAHGIDICSWETFYRPVDNPPRPVDFAIQRTSYGLIEDSQFRSMQPGIMQAPVKGAYHYPSSAIPWKAQADFHIDLLGGKYDFFAWDPEKGYNGNTTAFIDGICPSIEYIAKTTKLPGLFYTNPDMWGTWFKPIQNDIIYLFSRTDINIKLWVAHYWWIPNPDAQPNYWKVAGAANMPQDWLMWQYDCNGQGGKGKQYGVGSAGLDLSVFNGNADALHKWLGNAQIPPQTGTTPGSTAYRVIYARINVRALPDGNSKWVRYAVLNERLQVVSISNGWAQLVDNTYVYAAYIQKV